jgi:pSer/pThr/pTyr-binding forkhead associated (FHA) protein
MPITVLVRSVTGGETRLTFDGTQRVVIGRGSSCDVRLPDASVSHRHASLQARGVDFVLVDEGSTNGTFVGGVRVAPRTSRIVRSGDAVRLGRVWIELRIDQTPITRDVAAATRDLALALVADVLAAAGTDRTMRLRVVEGRDQGATLALVEEGRAYVLGRAAECDLPLADADASREHAAVVRRGGVVAVRDLAAKNGTWLGETRIPGDAESVWRPAQMMQIGRTVVALEEPLADALARIEGAPDEAIPAGEKIEQPPAPPPLEPVSTAAARAGPDPGSDAPVAVVVAPPAAPAQRRRSGWSVADFLVMAAALAVLALSIVVLVWLLRG